MLNGIRIVSRSRRWSRTWPSQAPGEATVSVCCSRLSGSTLAGSGLTFFSWQKRGRFDCPAPHQHQTTTTTTTTMIITITKEREKRQQAITKSKPHEQF